jgi:hypothetical protein
MLLIMKRLGTLVQKGLYRLAEGAALELWRYDESPFPEVVD